MGLNAYGFLWMGLKIAAVRASTMYVVVWYLENSHNASLTVTDVDHVERYDR